MYPPEIEILDDRFAKLALDNVRSKGSMPAAAGGGPAYLPAASISSGRTSQQPGAALRRDQRRSLGLPFAGRQPQRPQRRSRGALVCCEHRTRCVSRIEHDGTRRVLADRFEANASTRPTTWW